MSKHSFAQQVLAKNNIKIFSGENQILQVENPILEKEYLDKNFTTSFTLHKHISIGNNKSMLIRNYEDLMKLGFQISRKKPSYSSFRGQKVEYFLIKSYSNLTHTNFIPPGHQIEHNSSENWIKLVGPNCRPRKVYLNAKHKGAGGKPVDLYNYDSAEDNIHSQYESYFQDISPYTYIDKEEIIPIEEIPILITADGKLVCIQRMKDNPTIGILGKKGRGKTLLMHGLVDRVHHKWNARCIIMNDGLSFQTKSWSLPWNPNQEGHSFFTNWLNQIGESTRPLPCVCLHPNVSDMQEVELENDVSYKFSLPFREIMKNPMLMFEGTDEELGKSGKYLHDLVMDDEDKIRTDGLLYAKTINDIKQIVNERIWIDTQKQVGGSALVDRQEAFRIPSDLSRGKIFSLLKELMNSQIFDANTNIPSKWIVDIDGQKYPFYPWDACLYCDLVPVIMTHDLAKTKWLPQIMRFIMDDIFENQKKNEIIRKNELEVWMFIDELEGLLSYAPFLESFRVVNKQGRFQRIGIVYATQYVGSIPKDIWLTTDYVISFAQNSDEAKYICSNYDILKHKEKELVKLPRFHCMIGGDNLVVYHTDGRRQVIEGAETFQGHMLPSVSQHSAPKKVGN